jgi:Holliday junction resolvase RusA-like endonuclease
VIPFLPPTSNHIYVTDWRRKVRFLSKEADAFKKKVITFVGQEQAPQITALGQAIKNDPSAVFQIFVVLYFENDELLNKTFGNGKKEAAATRYKRMDVENRVKLVVDSFSKAIGIDDSLFFCGGHAKCSVDMVGGTPQTHIFFKQASSPQRFGIPPIGT